MNILVLLLFLAISSGLPAAPQSHPLTGTWEKFSMKDDKGADMPSADKGTLLIITTDGYYAQIEIPKNRKFIERELGELTKEDLLNRFKGLIARFGTYRIVGDKLVRSDMSHSDPSSEGFEQVQAFRVEGDVLILTNPVPNDKSEIQFRRMKAATETPADPAKVEWLAKNQVPLQSIDPSDVNFEDLMPLKKCIGSARVVMLGEQSHGDGATFDAKTRLIRFLHEQMGFNVLAFESGLYDCEAGNRMLGEGKPIAEILISSIFGIWARGEKLVPLFNYLAATAKSKRPLALSGFDIQFSAFNQKRTAADFLAELTAGLAAIDQGLADEETQKLLSRLTPGIADPASKPTKEERESDLRRLKELLDGVVTGSAQKSSRDNDFTIRLLHNLVALTQLELIYLKEGPDSRAWDSTNLRDRNMAENIVWLLEERYKGEKIIVWAASMHIARDAAKIDSRLRSISYADCRSMGQGVWDVLKDQMYAIAFTAYDGACGPPGYARALAPASEASLEGLLHATGMPLSFLDFRALPADSWLRQPLLSRPLGYATMLAAWPLHFDAMLYTETMYPNPLRADWKKPD